MPVSTNDVSEPISRPPSHRHELIKAWIAAILWMIVIAIESTSYLSANNTSRFLYPLLHYLFGITWHQFEPWHFLIRKGGHVVGYALLSLFLYRAWKETLPAAGNPKWTGRWTGIALFGTALIASLDEWHQSFLPSRTGRWQDVVLDTVAAICAQALLFFYWRWF